MDQVDGPYGVRNTKGPALAVLAFVSFASFGHGFFDKAGFPGQLAGTGLKADPPTRVVLAAPGRMAEPAQTAETLAYRAAPPLASPRQARRRDTRPMDVAEPASSVEEAENSHPAPPIEVASVELGDETSPSIDAPLDASPPM